MSTIDPRNTVRRLYEGKWGYAVSDVEEARVGATQGSSTYGEMLPTAVDQLVDALDPSEHDVFYDLGSGMGKVVMQVAMTRKLAACVGIELVASRHRVACEVLARAREEGLLRTADVSFRNSDMLRARISDATIIYTCSTAFSDAFMARVARRVAGLASGLRLATLLDLDDNPWFSLEDVLRLDVSWRRRAKLYIYRLTSPR